MNFVKIYDNVFNTGELQFIMQNFFPCAKTSETNIINKMQLFPKKELLYSLAVGVYQNVSKPVISHSIVMETYCNENKDAIYWEPHHDGQESKVITLVFVDCEDTEKWIGGELDIYTSLDAFLYPNNKQRIDPVPGRVVVFDSSMVHCIRPYFGNSPRKSVSIGWE